MPAGAFSDPAAPFDMANTLLNTQCGKANYKANVNSPSHVLETLNWHVAVYDVHVSTPFNFIYDVLQFSSGRDKFCALMQGCAKFASEALATPGSDRHWMFRSVEDSLSDGRKIFRLFKEIREVYKVRRGWSRFSLGCQEDGALSIPATCGVLDMLGHSCSFFYYLGDNLLWAASVGLVRSKEVPRTWKGGSRENGAILSALGGASSVKRKRNWASMWRLHFAISANILLLYKAVRRLGVRGLEGPDDARLFHSLEILGMLASYQVLLSNLKIHKASVTRLGLLAMLAAACGIWSNWRKVRRKNCGAKTFVVAKAMEK
ncbi:unnamed protein product [Effrenium voratum]|nr:unnamed protein product [Effrenium voratum]